MAELISLYAGWDYWTGTECLARGVPYLTPGAIASLAQLLAPGDRVLEIGSGGSTVFFAERCAAVVTIDTDRGWWRTTSEQLQALGRRNVLALLAETPSRIIDALDALPQDDYSVVIVDAAGRIDRSALLEHALALNRHAARLVIQDNYADQALWPAHWNWSKEEMVTWIGGWGSTWWRAETHDDAHWAGRGTRLYVRGDPWT